MSATVKLCDPNTGCGACAHEGHKLYIRGDWEEMRQFCRKRRIYEPSRVCDQFKPRDHER